MLYKKTLCTTHNIKQLGFSGLRAFVFQSNFFLGGYRCAPKTQPFHIVKRWVLYLNRTTTMFSRFFTLIVFIVFAGTLCSIAQVNSTNQQKVIVCGDSLIKPLIVLRIDDTYITTDSIKLKNIDPRWIKKFELIKQNKDPNVSSLPQNQPTIVVYFKRRYIKDVKNYLQE